MSPAEDDGPGKASTRSAAAAEMLEHVTGSWNAWTGMWNAWFDATKSLSRERGTSVEKSLTPVFDPEFWKAGGLGPLLEELQSALSVPKLADVPSLELSMLNFSATMLDLAGLFQQYVTFSIPMWIAASQRFQAEVSERAKRGEKIRSPGEALDLWNGVLDHTLMEFNRSGEFTRIQQRLLRASLQQRLELRKIGERTARMFDMPTRKEMTDLYRRMHEMQRELHRLRREVRSVHDRSHSASNDEPPREKSEC
jgi:hypothetical protein